VNNEETIDQWQDMAGSHDKQRITWQTWNIICKPNRDSYLSEPQTFVYLQLFKFMYLCAGRYLYAFFWPSRLNRPQTKQLICTKNNDEKSENRLKRYIQIHKSSCLQQKYQRLLSSKLASMRMESTALIRARNKSSHSCNCFLYIY